MSDTEVPPPPPSSADILRLLDTVQTAVEATTKSAQPLVSKAKNSDASLDFNDGISLLLVRPHLLLASLHHLVILTGLRLAALSEHTPDAGKSSALAVPFADGRADARAEKVSEDEETTTTTQDELAGELALCHEVMDKVRGMETKLEYQVKKLVGLAEADAKAKIAAASAGGDDDEEEDMLAFRPNASSMVAAARADDRAAASKAKTKAASDDEDEDGVYRPPRVAAVPYNEPNAKSSRSARRAPALLSEFAQGLDGAPAIQTTSGLSTRPVLTGAATNSASAKRAAELKRIREFEEDNMTRLVTSKREQKRRRDDEEALALGYGVDESARGRARRRNGLEAELEGVLGERGSKGVWDGVSSLGKEGITSRAKRADKGERAGAKKDRFAKDVMRKRRAIGLVKGRG